VRRVTGDSNIIISALSRGGKPQELLDLARHGGIEPAVSDAILDEVGRILSDKFEWSAERVNNVRAEIAAFTKHAVPTETLDVVKDDASDNRIVECAVAAGSDVIVSGDKHLLALGSFRGIEVMTVSDFLQRKPRPER
jgi:putative PIN family toxin of toxin-antitoxin system